MCYQNRRCEHTFRLSFYLIKLLLNKHSDIIDNLDIYNVNYLVFYLLLCVISFCYVCIFLYSMCSTLYLRRRIVLYSC